MKDYYKILGVDSSATDDEIKRAYKKLAMKHHPDRGGDQAAFQEIQEAYATLTDAERKAQWQREKLMQQQGQNNNFNWFGSNDFHDIFSQFHRFGGRQPHLKNKDLRIQLVVDLKSTLEPQKKHLDLKSITGNSKTIELDIPRGIHNGLQMRCAGLGEQQHKELPPGDLYVDFMIEPNNNFLIDYPNLVTKFQISCIDAMFGMNAKISGLDDTEFSVKIPAGSKHGTKFRLPGHGLWVLNRPQRGDLFIELDLLVPTTISKEQIERLKTIEQKL
jgi:curved DNA-binding protein